MDQIKIKIEIDGKEVSTEQGTMLIEAADSVGIHIPRFCYHKKLSISANCRMCLVEVEKSGKPLPACATPVTDGMKVFTQSPMARDAQKAVMEFLLANHPLDCPICDQGGECELQDVSMDFGQDSSDFDLRKRSVADEDLGPLISSDMTRCIHCTRCVRFGAEIAGYRELGVTGRGEETQIGTYIKENMHSEVSGNVIDLCPVGALTNKPFRFRARAWELKQSPSISPHDCLGTNIYLHTHRNTEVVRVVPRENESINETWISDRDRFGFQGIHHKDRVSAPLVKRNGTWNAVTWDRAFEVVVDGLKKTESNLAGIISSSATIEEQFLFQQLIRGLGSDNIDHRTCFSDFSHQVDAPLYPSLGVSIADLEECDAILLVGSNVCGEQPLASLRIRKGVLHGNKAMAINVVDYDFIFDLAEKMIVDSTEMVDAMKSVADGSSEIAKILHAAEKGAIILGPTATNHPQASALIALAKQAASALSVSAGCMTDGANTAGAWLSGCVPHRGPAGAKLKQQGKNLQNICENPEKAYLLFNVEPESDCLYPDEVLDVLKTAEFVVSFSPFVTDIMGEYADVILPIGTFAETSGTYVNIEGKWQSFAGAIPPVAEARPGWKVLRVLGNYFDLDNFDFLSSEEIRDQLKALVDKAKEPEQFVEESELNSKSAKAFLCIREMYNVDGLVRRSKALQSRQGDKSCSKS